MPGTHIWEIWPCCILLAASGNNISLPVKEKYYKRATWARYWLFAGLGETVLLHESPQSEVKGAN